MIFCKELNKSFSTKEDMFRELKKHVKELIKLKCEKVYYSCEKGIGISLRTLDISKISESVKLPFETDNDHYYIAVNTCLVLDSHDDLHDIGIWNDSVVSEQGKNYLVADHSLTMANVIVKKKAIEQFIADIPFAALGKSYSGDTQALIYKFRKDAIINQTAKDWLDSGDDIEASVRMQYEDIYFAMDSNNPDDANEKAIYDMYYPKIANKADFDYIPYFFLVKKAVNKRESSLVIAGSNPVTGPITISENKNIVEPEQSRQAMKSSLLLI